MRRQRPQGWAFSQTDACGPVLRGCRESLMRRGRSAARVDVDGGNLGSGREGNGTGRRSAGKRSDGDENAALAAPSRVGAVFEAPPPRGSPLPATTAVTSSTPTPNGSQNPTPKRRIADEGSQISHDVEAFPVRDLQFVAVATVARNFSRKRFPLVTCAAGPHACVTPVLLHLFEHRRGSSRFRTRSRSA